jgi:hypothetical protein
MLQEDKIKEEANMEEYPLRTARGFACGCLLSTGIWLVIIFIGYMIM